MLFLAGKLNEESTAMRDDLLMRVVKRVTRSTTAASSVVAMDATNKSVVVVIVVVVGATPFGCVESLVARPVGNREW